MKSAAWYLVAIVLLAACAVTPATTPTSNPPTRSPSVIPTPSAKQIDLKAADNGKTVEVGADEIVAISLSSNPSTGYRWKLVTEPDAKILKLITTDFVSSNLTPMPGSGGTDIWKFQAVGSGKTLLKLGLFPPSNANQATSEFILDVSVK